MTNRTVPNGHRQANTTAAALVLRRARVTPKGCSTRHQITQTRSPIPSLMSERLRLPDPDPSLATNLGSAWWMQAFGASRGKCTPLTVYIAGCLGTSSLAALLGAPIFKAGTALDCEARIADLNSQRYGSYAVLDGRMVEGTGYNTWQLARLSAPPTHPLSPVRVMPRWLLIDVPWFLSTNEFEFMLNQRLESLQLARIAGTAAGRAQCRQRDCDPDQFMRYSRHGRDLELATELTLLGPSADTGRLIALIEAMLVEVVRVHVGGER